MSRIGALADALTDAINAKTWREPLTALRVDTPSVDLEDLDQLRAIVIPTTETRERVARIAIQHDYRIQVGLQERLRQGDQIARAEQLRSLADDLADWLMVTQPGGSEAYPMSLDDSQPVQQHLDDWSLYTHVLSVTYQEITQL